MGTGRRDTATSLHEQSTATQIVKRRRATHSAAFGSTRFVDQVAVHGDGGAEESGGAEKRTMRFLEVVSVSESTKVFKHEAFICEPSGNVLLVLLRLLQKCRSVWPNLHNRYASAGCLLLSAELCS